MTAMGRKADSAYSIYMCDPRKIKRFSERFLAFKRVSEEIGAPWFEVFMKNLFSNVKNGKIGKDIHAGTPKEARSHAALWVGASTWNRLTSPYGEGQENVGLLSWKPLNVPEVLKEEKVKEDPTSLTKKVKTMARFFGADRVGIAELNRLWVYSETCRNVYDPHEPITKKIVFEDIEEPEETEDKLIIPDTVKYAVVLIFSLEKHLLKVGSASIATSAATNMGYSRMGLTEIALAEAMRAMGYNAIPCKNGTALSIPLAIDAGLGQLGRNGLLITPDFGPSVRIGKVLTDMPLVPDKPLEFNVTKFCESCKRCVEVCEVGAIPGGSRSYEPPVETGSPGALKWYIDGKKCLEYWIDSGASCSACQAVCPFSKTWYEKITPSSVWSLGLSPMGIEKE